MESAPTWLDETADVAQTACGGQRGTGEVVAQTLTSHRIDDASQVAPLLAQVDDAVGAIGGDGAYDKQKVFDALATPTPAAPRFGRSLHCAKTL